MTNKDNNKNNKNKKNNTKKSATTRDSSSGNSRTGLIIGAAALTGVGALLVAPVAVAAAGFGTVGIAAGSLGASMMSWAATTGFGMAVVSALQSAGAAGIGLGANALIGLTGAAVGGGAAAAAGAALGNAGGEDRVVNDSDDSEDEDDKPSSAVRPRS